MIDLRLAIAVCTMSLALNGCSPGNASSTDDALQSESVQISPQDFVLLPCSGDDDAPCALVMAGGKRLLFGAPAGISARLDRADILAIDAVFLFSLRYEDVEGLDEVRDRGWRSGRMDQLVVSGPEGVNGLLDGLNLAYEQSDALSFVEEGAPAGGFDAALLTLGAAVTGEKLIFDTGDLKVRAIGSGTRRVTYRIGYLDVSETWHDVVLQPCNGPQLGEASYLVDPVNSHRIGCGESEEELHFPLTEPYFVEKSNT